MKQLVYDPTGSGKKMEIVCFVSGSGTNYREIAARGPDHDYLVFTNRPGCAGVAIARRNRHEVIELSHMPYLKGAAGRYGPGKVPRNCPERVEYEREVVRLIESRLGRQPDLTCLAGYDQWLTDWTVDRYFPRVLNIHPGDTTKGYDGLHWAPSARAILAGDKGIRSTLFFVDRGEDTGPVLVQSAPLDIVNTLREEPAAGTEGLVAGLRRIIGFAAARGIKTHEDFTKTADEDLKKVMAQVCGRLQEALKVAGDWQIYPFAVHDLIAAGRVAVDGRTVYVDGEEMPGHGYRMDEHQ